MLARCDGVVTGYLGKAETGQAALDAVAAVRKLNPDAAYACDPVIGDEGRGVYVREGVAEFFRDRAIPSATIVSPNAFELSWLTGKPTSTRGEAVAALEALRARGPQIAYATSLRLEDTPADALDLVVAAADGRWRVRTPKLADLGQRRRRSVQRAVFARMARSPRCGRRACHRRRPRLRRRRRDGAGEDA